MAMSTFISKDTVQRLLKDVKQIMKHPLTDQGIHYVHDETDMLKGYAMIEGPADTPYFGGYYFFQFTFPCDYPHSPPQVTYHTNGQNIRFNPNLYPCGKVCISLLNTWRGEQWTSCQTISTVLLTLCTLLCANPLINEPGVHLNFRDVGPYNDIIEYANISIAVCDIVSKNAGVYMEFFDRFYSVVRENFLRHVDHLLRFAETKCAAVGGQPFTVATGYYQMHASIDYRRLLDRLHETKQMVLSMTV